MANIGVGLFLSVALFVACWAVFGFTITAVVFLWFFAINLVVLWAQMPDDDGETA